MKNKNVNVNTPCGPLSVSVSGSPESGDYPGLSIDLTLENGDVVPLCIAEFDNAKRKLQVCVYADVDSDDPTAICETNAPLI